MWLAPQVAHCLSSSSHSLRARWLSRCAPVLRACRPYVIFPNHLSCHNLGTLHTHSHSIVLGTPITFARAYPPDMRSISTTSTRRLIAAMSDHIYLRLYTLFSVLSQAVRPQVPIRVHVTSCFRFECNTAPSTAWCMPFSLRSNLCYAYFASSRGAWCRPEAHILNRRSEFPAYRNSLFAHVGCFALRWPYTLRGAHWNNTL